MNFKQIEAFRAVMLSGSMTAAAHALHTSQPNISRLISQLERACGFNLFERAGVRLLPTHEGAALFEDVERSFVGLQSIEESAHTIRREGTGQLRIGAVPSLTLTLLPRVIQRFRQDNPGVAISLHTNDSPAVARWTASQFCDVALVSYVAEQTPGVTAQVLCDVPGVCIFPGGHRLQALAEVTPADLKGEEFISLLHNDGSRSRVDRAFPDTKGYRRLNLETPYAATICSMVGLGLGVSIVSPLVAGEYGHIGLQARPFTPQVRFTTYLLLPADRPQSLLSARFCTLVTQMMQAATQPWRE